MATIERSFPETNQLPVRLANNIQHRIGLDRFRPKGKSEFLAHLAAELNNGRNRQDPSSFGILSTIKGKPKSLPAARPLSHPPNTNYAIKQTANAVQQTVKQRFASIQRAGVELPSVKSCPHPAPHRD
jgi:hypothetical protein